MCEVLLLAFRTSPISPKLFETFATACGGIQQGAAWILSAMVCLCCFFDLEEACDF
jgi:hypothetical protein